jgi:chitin disaccharide deacetylase
MIRSSFNLASGNTVFRKLTVAGILILAVTLSISPQVSAQKLSLPLKWATNHKSFIESAATVADVNNDGLDEAVITTQEEIVVIGKSGADLWRWRSKGRFMTYPTVLKRAGKSALIYAADNRGNVTCLDGAGKVIWQATLESGTDWSAGVIADLYGDGHQELIQTDATGNIWIFDALNGTVLKKTKIAGQPVSPSVGDLDGDGKLELVIATTDGSITALTSDLSTIWRIKIGGESESWSTSAPVMFSASNNKSYIIAASSTGEIFCLDAKGKAAWQYPTNVPVSSSISIGDFDQDGEADIFLITHSGIIYRFDERGNVLWNIDMQGRSLAPGAIADINGDGKFEYIVTTQVGHLLVLNNQGTVIFDHQLPSRAINVTASIGHVTGDNDKLDLVLTGGESGMVYCFQTPILKNPKLQWTNYRANIHNTGAWFGLTRSDELRMVPQNLAWDKILNGEKIQFNITNPKPTGDPLKANVQCLSPNGTKNSAIASIYNKEGQLYLPANFTIPGSYQFSWSVSDSKGTELLSASRTVTIQPFENDRALALQAIKALNSSAEKVSALLPLSASALRKEASNIEAEAKNLSAEQVKTPQSNSVNIESTIKSTATLNEASKRAIGISEVVTKAASLGARTSIIAFEGNKWENRKVDKQLPSSIENPVTLNHQAVPGEHHPIPIVLFNVTDHLLNGRVVLSNTVSGIKVTLLHAINTVTSLGEESWDALPELDESGVVSIPPLSSREVWIDLELEPNSTGKQNLEFTIQALNGAGVLDAPTNPHEVPAPETKVIVALDILPFKMAPSSDFRMCTWSPSTGPEIPSLLAHGNNVFLLTNPIFKYNEKNELIGFDYSAQDQALAQFKGKEVFLLINGLPGIKDEFASEGYKKQFNTYLKDLVAHLSSYGFGISQFALYPIDEPGGNGWNAVNQVVKFGEIANAVNPDVMIYQDGGGELPMFQAMSKSVNVWSPTIDWIADNSPEMDIMRTKKKFLWSYNCSYASSRPIGPNIKNINLIYEFRTAALLALRNGASGIGFWCYSSNPENPWSRIKQEYNLVYPGKTKSITSRRWEAVREGIEDYRILAALKIALSDAALEPSVRQSIDHLINISLPELVDPGYQAMKLGFSREVFDFISNDLKMTTFRAEMMSCIQLMNSKTQAKERKTSAEKLGFPAGKKVILLHIDDVGMCPEANTSTQKYISGGFLNSAAVMMPCPNAEAIIEWAKGHPSADFGLHLTLTSEWVNHRWGPVSDPAKVPGLIDPEGKLWPEVPDVLLHASAAEVETEIRAQIEKSIKMGYRPNHIDTHMGTLYGSEGYIKAFLKVAQEYHIPGNIIDFSNPETADAYRKTRSFPITEEVINSIEQYKMPKLDNFTSVQPGETYEIKRTNFFTLVKSLKAGLTEIIFHPSVPTENLKSITGTWQQRGWEGDLFADPVVIKFLKDEGVIITDWKEIMKKFDTIN